MRTWTPRTPPAALTRRPVEDSPRWRAYLATVGYAPAELGPVLTGAGSRPPAPGLVEAAELRTAALERGAVEAGAPLDAAGQAAARAAAVRAYLEDHPPARALQVDVRPVPLLSPEALGARLIPVGWADEAQVLEDLVTGSRWWTVGEAGALAGLAVVAGALYRRVGVAAPAARLAVVAGERRAVHPEPRAWEAVAGQVVELQAAHLAAELPADAWTGWRAGLAGMRGRALPVPAPLAATMRLELGACLGRHAGRAAPTWGVEPAELGELRARFPWSTATPASLAPVADRLAAVTDAQVRQAVALGQLEDGAAERLAAVLIGRRDAVARAVRVPAGGARPGR